MNPCFSFLYVCIYVEMSLQGLGNQKGPMTGLKKRPKLYMCVCVRARLVYNRTHNMEEEEEHQGWKCLRGDGWL